MSEAREHSGMGMRRAAIIQFVSKYAAVLVQLLITAILARLVSAAEFGTLAVVTVFTTFFTMFADMGIGVAIVQFRDLEKEDFQRLLGFSVVLALALGVSFCGLSVPISWVYGDPALVPLCCVASLSLVFSTLNMVPNGVMLRERKFSQIGLRLVVSTIVSGVVGIALAALGFGCYALVIQNDVLALAVLVWNLLSRPIGRPIFSFASTLRRVFSYSAFQFASGLVNYFNRNLDNLLIGKVVGVEALGYYDKAYKLTTYPMSSFSSVIASVIQPFMAEHQDDPHVIFGHWLRVTKLCSLVGVVVATIMFCCSEEIILIMYGNAWMASVPLLHALALGVYAQMIGNPTGAFLQSLGRTDLAFVTSVVNTGIMVVAIVGGLAFGGIEFVAWCVGAAFFVQLASIAYFLVHRGCGERLSSLRAFLPELVAGALACVVGMAVGNVVPHMLFAQLGAKIAVCCGVLLAAYAATGQLDHIRSLAGR